MIRKHKYIFIMVFFFLFFISFYLIKLLNITSSEEIKTPYSGAPISIKDPIERGEYLARAADCVACHTAPGGKPFAGGYKFNLPFGSIYGTNITADKESGIGNWTDAEFIRAVRQGVGPKGNLYPAMPYTSYTRMTRDDVLAIKAYLFSLPPVNQKNPNNDLSFPFNQRWGMKFWNFAFFHDERFETNREKDAQWNRGAYLATALGHCSECHTPRSLAFSLKNNKNLSGENVQGWFAANITPDEDSGIGSWSDKQISDYLAKGHADGRSSASGPMAEVVENSTQYLSKEDNMAIVAYLRSLEKINNGSYRKVNLTPSGANNSSAILPNVSENSLGSNLFAGDCSGCHQWNGIGRQSPYASLKGSTAVNDPSGASIVQAILYGTSLTVDGKNTIMMPDFSGKYSDKEVAAVANYVLRQFGDKEGKVTKEQVSKARDK